jgi:hypothetical protein
MHLFGCGEKNMGRGINTAVVAEERLWAREQASDTVLVLRNKIL